MDNETILGFINSKDIRNHLRFIGYSFNTLESAWLVYQCRNATLAQKHKAWNNIISSMPDMPIDLPAFKHRKESSVHDFLNRYIEIDNRWINLLIQNENSMYFFYVKLSKYDDYCHRASPCVFSSFENCIDGVKSWLVDFDEQETRDMRIKIVKKEIDDPDQYSQIIVYLNENIDILSIEYYGTNLDEDQNIHLYFEEMCFSFPTPFSKGDIIYDITPKFEKRFCCGPLVMTGIATEQFEERGRLGYDVSDMTVDGYFLNENGIYTEVTYNYMDFEYCTIEKLTGKRRALIPISNYLKGEIDIGLCLMSYHQILLEELSLSLMPDAYTKEGIEIAQKIKSTVRG